MKKILTFTLTLSMLSGFALADGNINKPVQVEDVEELLDNTSKFQNKRVTVIGEVEEKIDSRSVVLESGGLFNDEITIVNANGKIMDLSKLEEDQKLQVTGTLRTIPVIEIEREMGWDFEPKVEAELESVQAFLVADEVKRL